MSEIIQGEGKVRIKKPKWLRVKLPTGEKYKKVRGSLTRSHFGFLILT